MNVDLKGVIGFIGVGGPYSFSTKTTTAVKLLLNQLFQKGYDRTLGEPCSRMAKSSVPMLLIQIQQECFWKNVKKIKLLINFFAG